MDEPDLSFINVNINLQRVKPLGTEKIVAFVNYFLSKNVEILNKFVFDMERMMVEMEKKLSRVEVELKLLELKLDSIPGMELVPSNINVHSQHLPNSSPDNIDPEIKTAVREEMNSFVEMAKTAASSDPNKITDIKNEPPQLSTSPERAALGTSQCLRIRDDPRYAVYFKMLKMGVPESAVKQKMLAEGVDTSLLNTPDAIADLPEDAALVAKNNNSTSTDDDQNSSPSLSDA